MLRKMDKTGQKVVVIGLDGASPELIRLWAAEGLLPSFSNLIEDGIAGDLASTVPAHSGPAWATAFTGVNPGKHGIFYFTTLDQKGEPRVLSSIDFKHEMIYDVMGRSGLRSIL